jgi:hypothetical protein
MASRQTVDSSSQSGFDYASGPAQLAAQAVQQNIKLSLAGDTTFNGILNGLGTSNSLSYNIFSILPVSSAVTGGGPGVAPVTTGLSGISASGTTVTVTTGSPHGIPSAGTPTVIISGAGVGGYNGSFAVTSVPNPYTFTFTGTSGLGVSGGGQVQVPNPAGSALVPYQAGILNTTIRGSLVSAVERWGDDALWDSTNSRYLQPGLDFPAANIGFVS